MMKNLMFLYIAVVLMFACNNKETRTTDEFPKDYIGKWEVTKKVYSNGIEDSYKENNDVYFLNEGGKLRREYRDHRDETRDQEGEWKIISKTENEKEQLYLIKRTPMFNGTFEEQFKVLSKTDTEMVLEENDWGIEAFEARDKFHFSKRP